MKKINLTDDEKKQWAPYCWYLLHLVAYGYCRWKEDKYYNFFKNLGRVLPCPKCRDHFKEYIAKHPIWNNTDLSKWCIAYHNDVNRVTNKPELSEADVKKLFYVGDDLPINHSYIERLLEILFAYHQEEGTLYVFKEFLYDLRKIFPCAGCRLELKKQKRCNIETYLKIAEGKYCSERNKGVSSQEFRI